MIRKWLSLWNHIDSNHKPFVNTPTLGTKQWTDGYMWKNSCKKILSHTDYSNNYYVKSTNNENVFDTGLFLCFMDKNLQ